MLQILSSLDDLTLRTSHFKDVNRQDFRIHIGDAYVDISRTIRLRPFKLLKYVIKFSCKHCNLTSTQCRSQEW
jgi:hypothetical protein